MERWEARDLLDRLERDAERIAERFGLRFRRIEAERPRVTSRYGLCTDDGLIKIRLRHATTGRPLKYSSLVSTLCHELAHLKHFDHGPRFQAFNQRVLDWARREGIYRPGRDAPAAAARSAPARRPSGPAQLDLFSGTRGRLSRS